MWKLSAALVHPACTLRQEERRTMLTATGIERALRELPKDMEHFLLTTGCRSTPRETHVDSPRKALVSVVWTYVCVFFMFLFFVSLFVFGFFLLFFGTHRMVTKVPVHFVWWDSNTHNVFFISRKTPTSKDLWCDMKKVVGKFAHCASHTLPCTPARTVGGNTDGFFMMLKKNACKYNKTHDVCRTWHALGTH